MTILLIQVLLIAGVVGVVARLISSGNARSQALRRLGLVVFAALAIGSIVVPESWTTLAQALGVGRGTDLILYGLVVAFLSFTASTYLRHRQLEVNLTRLARRLALDEAGSPDTGRPRSEPLKHDGPDDGRH